MTYAEFFAMLHAYQRRQRRRNNELIYTAWHSAAFRRMDRLPALQSVLVNEDAEPEPAREQTTDEMIAVCKLLTAAFGGKVVEV